MRRGFLRGDRVTERALSSASERNFKGTRVHPRRSRGLRRVELRTWFTRTMSVSNPSQNAGGVPAQSGMP